MTIYSSLPYQVFMVHAIKSPITEGVYILASPTSSNMQRIKAIRGILKGVKAFRGKFPEPQKGIHPETGLPYIWHPNSERLIELRDEFFTHCLLEHIRLTALRMAINAVIIIYDYDPPYRMMIDWWAKKLRVTNWNYDVPITVVSKNWAWWKE